jgi:GrpB-like predicted nucleotidyltransferase (UPF0157 family)
LNHLTADARYAHQRAEQDRLRRERNAADRSQRTHRTVGIVFDLIEIATGSSPFCRCRDIAPSPSRDGTTPRCAVAHRAVLLREVVMHSVAVLTDPHLSDAAMTAASEPPIGRYLRVPVEVHQADPHVPEVARRLIALIATRWPDTPAEHVGSTAVPGLAGKGIIDLLLAADPADIPAITGALVELGFQHQSPAAFPASRPMLWGVLRHGAADYRVHVHVVPACSPEVAAMRGFRDALRADPTLRRRYAALKRAIVAGGPVDPIAFTNAKHDWIVATLRQLGLVSPRHHQLYEDDPSPDSSRLAA